MKTDFRTQFETEKLTCTGELSHISQQSEDPALIEIDSLYGCADELSMYNAKKHRMVLWLLSAVGTLLTLLFLLYDEAELYGLILACGVMILSLFLIRSIADRTQCHRKYLEYRVLAESLRVQYYIFLTGARDRVADLIPWSVRQGIPWVEDILSGLPEPQTGQKQPMTDFWIKDQKSYHEVKLGQMIRKNRRDSRIAAAAIVVTIITYAAAMVFELMVFNGVVGSLNTDLIRAVIKIVVGTMSAFTLFTGNYYGKMSLPNVIDDHKRMIALYERAQEQVNAQGENREIMLFLARECLNENSTWYAYQNKNKPDLVI